MNATIHFKGGPLGGEVRAWPWEECHRSHTIRVPGMFEAHGLFAGGCSSPDAPFPIFPVEEYKLYRQIDGCTFEYWWVNPNAGLVRELRAVKEHRDSLVVELCAAIDKIDRLKRLKKVAKLLASLQDLV